MSSLRDARSEEESVELVSKGKPTADGTVADLSASAADEAGDDAETSKIDASATETSSSSSSLVLFSLVWWVAIFFFFLNGQSTKKANACLASARIVAVLEYVPYKLHSVDLQSAVYTINTVYNVQTKFFDNRYVDVTAYYPDPVTGVTPLIPTGPLHVYNGSLASFPNGDPYNFLREYNIFSLTTPYPNTIAGSTNWMEYQVTFNDLNDMSMPCLMPLASFNYYSAPGVVQG